MRMIRIAIAVLCAAGLAFAQANNADLRVLPVQGNVYMLTGPGGNISIQTGKDGALLVDTMTEPLAARIAAEVQKLTPLPIRYIIDTSMDPDHLGGNAALGALGAAGAGPVAGGGATIIANENVLNRMTTPVTGKTAPPPERGLPNDEYFTPTKDFFFNGEAVVIFHEEKAHTDGDSMVFFRRSDVLSTGDIFMQDRYPVIDLEKGGSIQGELAALNFILHLTVPERLQDGGTRVIPGHGRICNEADVVEYRDMATIVRDRIQDLVKKGNTLAQVKAARLTLDYDAEYGSPDRFVESVYRSLGGK